MFQPASPLTLDHARSVLEGGLRAIESGGTRIDLSRLTAVDSSAVAAVLAWQRAAAARGATLVISGLPASLRSLADLYGVTDLLAHH